jgi:AcrR family transcriptional regulator
MPTSPSSNAASDLSRRERERLMRRRAMLRAAQSVFAEKGYARATLDEVAERAEFGKGTIYNYFEGGKEEILFAIFDEIYDDVGALIAETCSRERVEETSLREAVHELVVRVFSFYQEREDLFIILIKEAYRLAFSDDPEKAEYFHRQQQRMVDALAPAVEAAVEEGRIRDLPPRAVAHMLLENLDGMVVHRCLAERREEMTEASGDAQTATPHDEDCPGPVLLHDPEAAADFLTTMLFDGLQAGPSPSTESPEA